MSSHGVANLAFEPAVRRFSSEPGVLGGASTAPEHQSTTPPSKTGHLGKVGILKMGAMRLAQVAKSLPAINLTLKSHMGTPTPAKKQKYES